MGSLGVFFLAVEFRGVLDFLGEANALVFTGSFGFTDFDGFWGGVVSGDAKQLPTDRSSACGG